MKNYRQLLKELPSNKVVFAFGRFQPPTAIHELQVKVVKKLAEQQRADYVIYASKDLKEELLPVDKKVHYMNLMFPNTNIETTDASTFVEAVKKLNKKYKNIVMVASADCKEDYEKILNKKNGTEFYFETIEVVAAGDKDPDENKLRESAKKGDYAKFKSTLPSALREIDSRRLMNDMRQSLGLDMVKEEIKLVKDELREQYFRGDIFKVGEIVESAGQQYEIVKRGSNHLLLKEESGKLVSKWIQDVTVVEGVIQQSGTDDLDPPTVDTKSTYNIAKDVMRYKDFKKLNAMARGQVKEQEEEKATDQVPYDEKPSEMELFLQTITNTQHTGHTFNAKDDQHRRRKVAYHLGEAFSEDEVQLIDEISNDLLNRYKEKAKQSADDLTTQGKHKKSTDRWMGVMKATGKQIEKTTAGIKKALNKEEVELQEEHLVHVDDGSNYGEKPHDKDVEHVMDGAKKHNGEFDGHSDKGAFFKFKSHTDARNFADHVKRAPHKTVHADLHEEIDEAKKKKKIGDDFKPSAVEVKMKDDSQQLGATNAHGFDAFFNEEEDKDFSEEEIDKMIDSMSDDDIMDAYDDDELAVIDDETGEEIEQEEDENNPDLKVKITEVLSRAERMRARVRFAKSKSKRERSAKLALKRTSSTGTINKRARRLAIKLMKQRMLRGRPASSLSVGEKERIEKMIEKRRPVINRIAMKLTSRVRQVEKARLQHHKFTQK